MINFPSHTPLTASPRRASAHTIYRDTPLAHPVRPQTPRSSRSSVRALLPESDHASDGILLGLAALTLPAVVYSFAQLWDLLAGGSLQHAIRAFLP